MSDGFSDPDPGVPEPDHDGEQASLIDDDVIVADDSVRCENCAHFAVCQIFGGIAPQLREDDWQEGEAEPPVDPNQLAVICDEFEPAE